MNPWISRTRPRGAPTICGKKRIPRPNSSAGASPAIYVRGRGRSQQDLWAATGFPSFRQRTFPGSCRKYWWVHSARVAMLRGRFQVNLPWEKRVLMPTFISTEGCCMRCLVFRARANGVTGGYASCCQCFTLVRSATLEFKASQNWVGYQWTRRTPVHCCAGKDTTISLSVTEFNSALYVREWKGMPGCSLPGVSVRLSTHRLARPGGPTSPRRFSHRYVFPNCKLAPIANWGSCPSQRTSYFSS